MIEYFSNKLDINFINLNKISFTAISIIPPFLLQNQSRDLLILTINHIEQKEKDEKLCMLLPIQRIK